MSEPTRGKECNSACRINWCFLFGCACVSAAVALAVCLWVSPRQPPRRLWVPVIVETNGDQTILAETRQLEFWTPSARTRDFLHQKNGEIADTERWQALSNEDAILQFGLLLRSNTDILGFRRVEVWGQGRTGFKPGWWWTVNVFTNYSVADLGRTYQKFWNAPYPVFIEVIDNRGSE